MADPIKASIEVEIDPTPDDFGRFEVHWPNGNRTWPTAENLTALGLPVPARCRWVDADGNPVLDDLTKADVDDFCEWVDQEGPCVSRALTSLARALRKQLEADQ